MPKTEEIPEDEFLWKWFAIADEMGVSEEQLKLWCRKAGIKLRHWGRGEHSGVVLSKAHILHLKTRLLVLGMG